MPLRPREMRCRRSSASRSGSNACKRCANVSDDREVDCRTAADVLRPDIDLRNARAAAFRIELPIREVRPEHQQDVAVEHRIVAGRETDQSGHTYVIGVVPFDVFLAAHGVHHRRLEAFAERQELRVRTCAARTAQNCHPAVTIQQLGQPLDLPLDRRDHRDRWHEPCRFGYRRFMGRLQGDVARQDHDRNAALANRLADCNFERARHLVSTGDQLAVMAALLEQVLRVGCLEISGPDFGGRNVRGDRKHGHARPMAVEQAVDEVQISGSAATSDDGEFPRQVSLGAGREGRDFFMPDVDPFDLALAPYRVGHAVQAIADEFHIRA